MPSLLAGVAACTLGGFFFLICGGILAAIAIPSFMKQSSVAKAHSAEANLRALWAAEQSWASAHDGEFLEFYVDSETPADANLRRLHVDLGDLHYAYEGMYDSDDVFVITAVGNIDEDESVDEWELFSDDPVPYRVYDDLAERDHYRERYAEYEDGDGDDDDEYVEEGGVVGGVIGGVGGLGLSGSGASDVRSATARENLQAIWEGQKAYRLKKKKFMAFDLGSPATWTALGLEKLPEAEHHTYSAKVSGDTLTLTATGNLDTDEFVDEWWLSSADGTAIQVKNDAINLDLSALTDVLKELSAQKEPE